MGHRRMDLVQAEVLIELIRSAKCVGLSALGAFEDVYDRFSHGDAHHGPGKIVGWEMHATNGAVDGDALSNTHRMRVRSHGR